MGEKVQNATINKVCQPRELSPVELSEYARSNNSELIDNCVERQESELKLEN